MQEIARQSELRKPTLQYNFLVQITEKEDGKKEIGPVGVVLHTCHKMSMKEKTVYWDDFEDNEATPED